MANICNGLLVRLQAKKGMGDELAEFLRSALPLAQEEEGTCTWYAVRFSEDSFGIFDTFSSEEGRQAHIHGAIAAALFAKGPRLLERSPTIEKHDVLGSKIGF